MNHDASPQVLGVRHTRPDFEVPPGSCDCHVHIFGPPDRFPFAQNRVFTPGPASVEDLLAHQRALLLDRVVLVQPSAYGTDNRCLADALERLGDQARGIAVIDPATSDSTLEDLHRAGVRGVRINLETAGQRDPALAKAALTQAAARVGGLGWHVQIYTNLDVIVALSDVLAGLPAPVMIDHYARVSASAGTKQPGFALLLELLKSGHVYMKLSAPHRISERPDHADAADIVSAFVEAAPHRTVWATDWPHGGAWPGVKRTPDVLEPFHPIDDGMALNHMAAWVSRQQLVRLLAQNPAHLYGF